MVKQYYQNVQYVVVKNQDLLKNRKKVGYLVFKAPLKKIPLLHNLF